MTLERQKTIDRIKHISEAGLGISFVLLIVLQLLPDLWSLDIPKQIDSIIGKVLITILFLSFAALVVSSLWATDEKREQDKADMKEILQEIKEEEEAAQTQRNAGHTSAKCPLIGLTPAQIGVVQEIIRDIPVKKYIGNAELMALCAALQADGYLPASKVLELDSIIDWVNDFRYPHKVDAVHFRHEFYNRPPKDYKVTKMANKVRDGFARLS